MYEGSFQYTDVSFTPDEIKEGHRYAIVGRYASGKTTALVKLAVSLCEQGKTVIFVDNDSLMGFIRSTAEKYANDMDAVKSHFTYVHYKYETLLSDLLDSMSKEFKDILDGAVIMFEQVNLIKTEYAFTDYNYKHTQTATYAIVDFCSKHNAIPVLCANGYRCASYIGETMDMARSFERSIGIKPFCETWHVKVVTNPNQNYEDN